MVVNPELSSGLPIPTMNRYPQPASRPERYSSPATKGVFEVVMYCALVLTSHAASDPVQNPYWKRDVRRAYPQLSMVTQSELSQLLLQHSRAPAYVGISPRVNSIAH